ncbi:MAG: rod shape-determining protein RodA [Actinomycetota bacterium]|nr:rod shape-determining protein RodA [Actinomycetota bacterium]
MRTDPGSPVRHLDLVLVGSVGAVGVLGALMIFSATRGLHAPYDMSFLKKQVMFLVLGGGAMAAIATQDYRRIRDAAPIIYVGTVVLLVGVLSPLGSRSKGTQGWYQLGPFQLQPSELAKLGLIIGLAALGSQFRGQVDVRRLGALVLVAALPMALVLLQPDLGTTLVSAFITFAMLLVAGVRPRHLAVIALVGIVGVTLVLQSGVLAQYQKNRLTVFVHQENPRAGGSRREAYNLDQAKIAIGSGGLTGEGLFRGNQTRSGYVPEQHTDFIFTAVGEQLGFIGGATLLLLLAIVVWRVWRAAQLARDAFGTLLCAGIMALFVFQIFENAGMTMGIMPITGIPLPFMSYGGSSTVTLFIAIGIVLSVHMRRFS